jgi:DsbC/DsbD-like thiol-disulfide interchange protein
MLGISLLAPSLAAMCTLFVPATSSQPAAEPHAKPRLIAEHSGVRPGGKIWLGITFDIDPHWHIYWDGDGDTGQPVEAKFTLPPGCKVNEIVWPTPKRQVLSDIILDYVYEDRVTLLVQLETPKTASPGGALAISAALKWMECSEECLPRKASVALSVPVVPGSEGVTKSSDAQRFEEARSRIPQPVEETRKVVQTQWSGDTLSLTVPGAAGLIFYPHRTTSRLANALEQGVSKIDRMDLKVQPGKGDRVVGILEVLGKRGDDSRNAAKPQSRFYAIDVPRAAPGGADSTEQPRK